MSNKNIFITGASGFIGANLTRHFIKKKYNVHIISRSNNIPWRLKDISQLVTTHKADITNYKLLHHIFEKIQPDYIIHLATYGAYHYQTDLKRIIKVNIDGIKNLLEASKNIPYKCFINTDSASEYDNKNDPLKEDDKCNPKTYYTATKLTSTYICKIFSELNNKPIITLRLFSVYGPYEEPTRFIPTILKSIILDVPIYLTPGNQRHDFVYIDDVIDAYLLAMNKKVTKKGGILNIGTGHEYTNDEIVKKLLKITNKKTVIKKGLYSKRAWDTAHRIANIHYAKKILGWNPNYNIDDGLQSTYDWFKKNLKFYI